MVDLVNLGFKVDSNDLLTADRRMDALDKSGKRVEDRSGGMARGFGAMAGAAAVAAGALGLGALASSTSAYIDALGEVSTLVDTTTFDMDKLSDAVLRQSQEYGTLPTDGAKAFYQAISAGAGTVAEATDAMDVANRLAVGGVTDVLTAVDGLTSSMNAYGGEAGSFTDISDAMFVSVKAGKTTIGELSSSIGKVAPLAATAGVSFEELLAATATLTKSGVTTSEAVTGIKGALTGILKPTKDASDLAASLGLEFNAAALETKGFAGFVQDVAEKTGGSTEQMTLLFGSVEGLNSMLALTGSGADDFAQILKDMENKSGATKDAFDKMVNSPGFQMARIKGSFSAGFTDLTKQITEGSVPAMKAFADYIPTAFTSINNAIDTVKLSWSNFKDALTLKDGETPTVLTNIGGAIKKIGEYLSPVIPYLDDFAVAIAAVSVAGATIGLLVGAIGLLVTPVGIVIAAVATLAVSAKALNDNWDGVVKWWGESWAGMKTKANELVDWWANTTFTEKALDIADAAVSSAHELALGFFDWWDASALKKHSPEIITTAIDGARAVVMGFFNWWNTTAMDEKIATIKTTAIDAARSAVEGFSKWWNSSTLTEKALSLTHSAVETAHELALDFFGWWDRSTLKKMNPEVAVTAIDTARTKLMGFFSWWNTTPMDERIATIKTSAIDAAKSVVEKFTEYWKTPFIKKLLLLDTAQVVGAEQSITNLEKLWIDIKFSPWTPEIVIDSIQGAIDAIENMMDWWDKPLKEKGFDIGYGLVEKAIGVLETLKNMWDGLVLLFDKALKLEIELPNIGAIGGDLKESVVGLYKSAVQGGLQALKDSDVKTAAKESGRDIGENIGKGTEGGIRGLYDRLFDAGKESGEKTIEGLADGAGTQSPSWKAFDIGMWTGKGMANGLTGSGALITEAAKEVSEEAIKTFDRIMSGLDDQITTFTGVTEGARKYGEQWEKLNQSQRDSIGEKEKILAGLEAEKKLREELTAGITQSLVQADNIRDAFSNLGDFMKDWLTNMIAEFAAKEIVAYVTGDTSGAGGLLSSVTGALSGGGAVAGAAGTAGGLGAAGASAGLASGTAAIGGLSAATLGWAAVAVVAAPKIVDAVEKVFGIGGGDGIFGSIQNFVNNMNALKANPDVFKDIAADLSQQAAAMGADVGENYTDSLTASMMGSISQGALLTADFFETTTRSAYKNAYDNLGPQVQAMIDEAVDIDEDSFEEIATEFNRIGDAATLLIPSLEAIGFAMDDNADANVRYAAALSEGLGGTTEAMATLDLYARDFSSTLVDIELETKTKELSEFNDTLGKGATSAGLLNLAFGDTFDGMIDTRAETEVWIETIRGVREGMDQSNESNLAAIGLLTDMEVAALGQLDAIVLVEDAQIAQTATMVASAQAAKDAHDQQVISLGAVTDATMLLNLNFDPTTQGALQMSDSLVQLMGGIDALNAANQNYYSTFFTAEEQKQIAMTDAAIDVRNFNIELGLVGEAAIDTREEMRKHVEGLDLTTEAGRQQYAQAMLVVDSMGLVVESGRNVEGIMAEMPENLRENFTDMTSQSAMSTAEVAQHNADMASKQVQAATTVSNIMTGMADHLVSSFGGIAVVADSASASVWRSKDSFDGVRSASDLATNSMGGLGGAANNAINPLNGAASSIGGLGGAANNSVNPFNNAAGSINSFKNAASAAKNPIDNVASSIWGAGTAASNVASKIGSLNFGGLTNKLSSAISSASFSALGSYETGTNYVPQTGLYELHQGEIVIPPGMSEDLRRLGATSDGFSAASNEVSFSAPITNINNNSDTSALEAKLDRVVKELEKIRAENAHSARGQMASSNYVANETGNLVNATNKLATETKLNRRKSADGSN